MNERDLVRREVWDFRGWGLPGGGILEVAENLEHSRKG